MSRKKMTYKEMINTVKDHTYTAPNDWYSIEADLDIADQISNLRTHRVPEGLWDKIDAGLSESQVAENNEVGSTFQRNNYRFYLIGLVLVFGLFSAASYLFNRNSDGNSEISYTSEVEIAMQEVGKVADDRPTVEINDAFDFINENEFLYTAKDKIDYEKQMADLESAKAEIISMQKQYGIDNNSQKMLAKIEREIAGLVKSMITGA